MARYHSELVAYDGTVHHKDFFNPIRPYIRKAIKRGQVVTFNYYLLKRLFYYGSLFPALTYKVKGVVVSDNNTWMITIRFRHPITNRLSESRILGGIEIDWENQTRNLLCCHPNIKRKMQIWLDMVRYKPGSKRVLDLETNFYSNAKRIKSF